MDQSFEAGLLKLWKNQFYEAIFEGSEREIVDEKIMLDFYSIIPFFYILVVGFLAALLAFLGEKFFAPNKIKILGKGKLKRSKSEAKRRTSNIHKVEKFRQNTA